MCSGWCNNWVTRQHARCNNENRIHICFFQYLTLFPVHIKDSPLPNVPKPTPVNINRPQNANSQLDNYNYTPPGHFPSIKESHRVNVHYYVIFFMYNITLLHNNTPPIPFTLPVMRGMCLFFAANNEKNSPDVFRLSLWCTYSVKLLYTAADYFMSEYIHTFKHQLARQQARARAIQCFCTNATRYYATLPHL